jgi:hypothetical protein
MHQLFNDGFIGHFPNSVVNFMGSDSEDTYKAMLKQKSENWHYRNNTITYDLNNWGHRCKRITDLNLDDYLLFVGCSHTMGIGICLEDSYPYIVSDMTNTNYYNLALGAAGIDALIYNLNVFLYKIDKKPKRIIWQWPDPARYLEILNDKKIIFHGAWDKQPEVLNFMITGDCNNFNNSRKILAQKFLEQISIPITYVSVHTPSELDHPETIYFRKKDEARDSKHFGKVSNLYFANILTNNIR